MRTTDEFGYDGRVVAELETFAGQEGDLHESLPESAHRWSDRHFLPKLNELGVQGVSELITEQIAVRAAPLQRDVVVLSLGSGNGDQELGWLRDLADMGYTNIKMRLLELNPTMQARAAANAQEQGFADRVELVTGDFNTWCADAEHDVVVGFHALHHVLDLEHLYAEVRASLQPDGVFVVHDMIGRNGHRRWPEALEVVERIWSTLPAELRRNAVTGEIDEFFDDRDCAVEGFEGIRAQDVLPVLLDYLHPSMFLALGNVVDPFVDRIYGQNFDMANPAHRELIDRIGALDDNLIDLGVVTPTRLTALFHPTPQPLRVIGDRTPQRTVRDTTIQDSTGRVSFDPRVCDDTGVVGGSGIVAGRVKGVYDDSWAASVVELPVLATDRVAEVAIRTYVPDWMPHTGLLTVSIDGVAVTRLEIAPGLVEQVVRAELEPRRLTRISLNSDWAVNPLAAGLGHDRRTVAYVLAGIELRKS